MIAFIENRIAPAAAMIYETLMARSQDSIDVHRFLDSVPGHLARPKISKPKELAVIGLITFLVLLPLCGIGVGAFDARIYEREDAARLGWRVLAHVGAFPDHNAGALDDRLRREHNQRSS